MNYTFKMLNLRTNDFYESSNTYRTYETCLRGAINKWLLENNHNGNTAHDTFRFTIERNNLLTDQFEIKGTY